VLPKSPVPLLLILGERVLAPSEWEAVVYSPDRLEKNNPFEAGKRLQCLSSCAFPRFPPAHTWDYGRSSFLRAHFSPEWHPRLTLLGPTPSFGLLPFPAEDKPTSRSSALMRTYGSFLELPSHLASKRLGNRDTQLLLIKVCSLRGVIRPTLIYPHSPFGGTVPRLILLDAWDKTRRSCPPSPRHAVRGLVLFTWFFSASLSMLHISQYEIPPSLFVLMNPVPVCLSVRR